VNVAVGGNHTMVGVIVGSVGEGVMLLRANSAGCCTQADNIKIINKVRKQTDFIELLWKNPDKKILFKKLL
jgi:hypothetical protein